MYTHTHTHIYIYIYIPCFMALSLARDFARRMAMDI